MVGYGEGGGGMPPYINAAAMAGSIPGGGPPG